MDQVNACFLETRSEPNYAFELRYMGLHHTMSSNIHTRIQGNHEEVPKILSKYPN